MSTTTLTTPTTNGHAPSARGDRIKLTGSMRWVPISQMKVSPVAQRDLNESRVNHMMAEFDLDRIGVPEVSWRDGFFWIIDGQHRIEVLRRIGWEDQKVECKVHEGLTEAQEAEMFLKLNDVLAVSAFDKYLKAVAAGRATESHIDRIIHSVGCKVTRNQDEGAIRAPGTLIRIYERGGPEVLRTALRIARDAYGDAGLESFTLDGMGYLCHRYDGVLNVDMAITSLKSAMGGASGLMNKAELIRRATGKPKGQCVAAAAVDILNTPRRGHKSQRLPSWWKESD